MGLLPKHEQDFRATSDLDAELSAQLRRIDAELAVLARGEAKAAAAAEAQMPQTHKTPVTSV